MRGGSLKERVHHALEVEEDDTRAERALNVSLLALILINVAAVVLETVPALRSAHGGLFHAIEAVSVAVFTVEYLLRLWSCTADPRYAGTGGRLRFALSPMALVDLAAIAPAYVPGSFLDLRFARLVRLVRLLRVLKVARYSSTIRTFARVAAAKRTDLAVIGMFLLVMLLLASSSMYFAEHHAQPRAFSSIPASMWWAIVTLTTVGYGDVVPVTPFGRVLGATIALIGIGFFALPAGVLAAAFAEELSRARQEGVCPACGRSGPREEPAPR